MASFPSVSSFEDSSPPPQHESVRYCCRHPQDWVCKCECHVANSPGMGSVGEPQRRVEQPVLRRKGRRESLREDVKAFARR